MASKEECAQLSLFVYGVGPNANQQNRPLLPSTWELAEPLHPDDAAGFSYGVFRRIGTTEIVVAYTGSNEGLVADYLGTNIPAALGNASLQVPQAALAYEKVLKSYGTDIAGSNITFTGHSLGGGLASVMAVWYNRPAVVFDVAPFALTAINPIQLATVRGYLALHGYYNAVMNTALTDYSSRQAHVQNYYLQGEILESARAVFPTVVGSINQPIVANVVDISSSVGGKVKLHSQALLTAMLLSPQFRAATFSSTRIIPLLMDSDFYAHNASSSNQQNVLLNFIRSEQGSGDKLTRFATDLNKLGTNIAGLNKAAQEAIVAQGIEWFYFQGQNYAGNQFFNAGSANGLLQYTTALGDGLIASQGKALNYNPRWLASVVGEHGASYLSGFGYDQWSVSATASGATGAALNSGKNQIFIGNSGSDTFTGGSLADLMFAGAGADTLDGGAGDDRLYGAEGNDTYVVGNGKDTVRDNLEGIGKLQLAGGATLTGGKSAGKANTWIGQNGETYTFIPTQGAQIGSLEISKLSTGGEVKIEKFDLAMAQTDGYLGIKLENSPKLILAVNSDAAVATGTPFRSYDFANSTFTGSSTVFEGSGRGFVVYLSQASKAGATLVLSLNGIDGKGLKAVLGNTTVEAQGATIALTEGQTQASFALVQDGAALVADATGSFSVAYGGAGQSATSNSWGMTLKDTGEATRTYSGDQRAKLIGIEIDPQVTPDNASYGTYKWSSTSWATDGTLTGGVPELNFADVIYASTGNDKVNGAGGNDALSGRAGSDVLNGGDGDDLIGGGSGADNITGGAGNDYISSAAGLTAPERLKPTDTWTAPGGTTVVVSGATWGIYRTASSTIWDGIGFTNTTSLEGDTIDAGAGDDSVIASWGGDRVQGGEGNDVIYALAGDDVVEGGAGNDYIEADGITEVGYLNTVGAASHGADFADGGDGNDRITGGGRADTLYGGAGNDELAGDYWGSRSGIFSVSLDVHGADFLDGEDGDDYLEGGGKDDTLYGGLGADVLWGDTSAKNVVAVGDNELLWGDDYLDGEEGNDQLVGGGKDDVLYGGLGDDKLFGDDAAIKGEFSGADYLDGEDGADYLQGDGNDDTLFGGTGADVMWGDAGTASLASQFHGDDYLDGEDGDDQMIGSGGADTLYGGLGADLLLGDYDDIALAEHGDDVLDGEEGDDRLYGYGGADLLSGGTGADLLAGNEGADVLNGDDGNDTMFGGSGADQLFGGAGADVMQGDSGTQVGDGDDIMDGQDGDDLMFGEGGSDLIEGGAGADRLFGGRGGTDANADADTINGGAGDDTLFGQGGDDVLDGGADNDIVLGGLGNDTVAGGLGADQLQGGEGDDGLDGGDGNDNLYGDAGADSLNGGGGSDYLIGGIGDDYLAGGDGNDFYFYAYGEGSDHISDTGGSDWLVFSSIFFDQVSLGVGSLKIVVPGGEIHLDDFDPDNPYGAGGIEFFQFADGLVLDKNQLISRLGFAPTGTPEADLLSGTALSETIRALAGDDVVTARAGDDTVYGDEGADMVFAGDGNDSIHGGAGDDMLLGEGGNDSVNGDAGNDVLCGGEGTDQLAGGEGDDSYLFQAGDGQDTVTDPLGQNSVTLGEGLTLESVLFGRRGADLTVSIKNSADRLTVKDWFAVDSHFTGVTLSSGAVIDRAAIEASIPANLAPETSVDTATVSEDGVTAANGNALSNDRDPEGRALQVTNPGRYAATYGSFVLQSDGSYSYNLANVSTQVQSLAASQRVTDTLTYTVSDGDPAGAATSEGAIVVTVLGSNDLPMVVLDMAATAEDTVNALTGNVLSNDSDIDLGTRLTIADPGARTGNFGMLALSDDGGWGYSLANASTRVQGLGAGQVVTDSFAFSVSDGLAQLSGKLTVSVAGVNDAPVVAASLADQAASANSSWNWSLPAGSFTDVDAGDILTYGARLADGTALPSWLTFDPATRNFSGRVPRLATGSIDIKVSATDRAGVRATDVFNLTFAAAGGGGGGGGNGGVGSQGNAGVGNGADAPPPGHTGNFNDGPGTGPGNPGARGGNGHRPPKRDDIVRAAQPMDSVTVESLAPPVFRGNSVDARAEAPGQERHASRSVAAGDRQASGQSFAGQPNSNAVEGAFASAGEPVPAFRDLQSADTNNQPPQTSVTDAGATSSVKWLTTSAWADFDQRGRDQTTADQTGGPDATAVFARWLAVQQSMDGAGSDSGASGAWAVGGSDDGSLGRLALMGAESHGSLSGAGSNPIGLQVGSGLRQFQGLGQGVREIL